MDYIELFKQILLCVIMGGLIGLERERKNQNNPKPQLAGVRTFTLVAIMGFLSNFLFAYSENFSLLIAGIFLLMLSLSYIADIFKNGINSATSEVTIFIVFIIGFLNANNNFILASLITIVTLSLLLSKEGLHLLAKKITKTEINSILKLILITLIILPILPDQNFGPYNSINLHKTWLMVVLISAITLVSYICVKFIGKKGFTLSGFLGGMVSSTAITLSFAGISKKMKDPKFLSVGITLANSAMFIRVLIEVAIININLAYALFGPMAIASSIGLIYSTKNLKENKNSHPIDTENEIKNPIQIMNALKFGLFFAIVSFAIKFLNAKFGSIGVLSSSLISGIIDTDAIALSLSDMSVNKVINYNIAAIGILIAVISNTVSKLFFCLSLGSRDLFKSLFKILALQIVILFSSIFLFTNFSL